MVKELGTKRSVIGKRIRQRLMLLEEWARSGVPAGERLPLSLVEAREWNAPKFGIQPIGSPSDFTTTHLEHGKSVASIAEIIKKLRFKYERSGIGKERSEREAAGIDNRVARLEDRLREFEAHQIHLVSQWSRAREQIEDQNDLLDDLAHTVVKKDRELAAKNEEIAELRRQLNSRQGLRLVE